MSGAPVLSANGRYVAFFSAAPNLAGQDTNHATDVFVRDLVSGTTRRVSVTGSDGQANGYSDEPAISSDGRVFVRVDRRQPGDGRHEPS